MRQAPDEIDMLLVVLDMLSDVNSRGGKKGAGGIGVVSLLCYLGHLRQNIFIMRAAFLRRAVAEYILLTNIYTLS